MAKPKSVTPEMLGHLLYEEFQRDSWGTLDPDRFKDPPKKKNPDKDDDHNGLYEVLVRVTKRLNESINKK